MKKKYNILITGCGGDIGQSLGKIAKQSKHFDKIFGCDMHDQHAGLFIFDACFLVDRVSSSSYFSQLEALISTHKIDFLIPSSEPELRWLAQSNDFQTLSDVQIIHANQKALEVGFDKLKTARFLEANGLPFPKSLVVKDVLEPKFPCILKDRFGAGSKALYLVKEKREFLFYKATNPNLLYQTFLPNTEGEYTCGLFKSQEIIRTIIFKRQLHGGYSGYGEIIENEAIEILLQQLAQLLDLEGCINVQLRLKDGVPYIFEINPRFSSTVLFRHLFGFCDFLWCIQAKMQKQIDRYTPPQVGAKFYKGFMEYISTN